MKIYSIGQISPSEKSDILNKHRSLYDGYKTMYPEVSNTQPLYVYDAAGDKDGITVSNKGDVKKYTNVGINEQVSKKVCSECGGMMKEGECSECGWKGSMEEQTKQVKNLKHVKDLSGKFDYIQDQKEMEETQQGNPYADEKPAYDFVSGGPGKAFREQEDDDEDFEEMHSAWDDDDDEYDDEVIDYLDDENEMSLDDTKKHGEFDIDDYDFDPKDKSWEEIKAHTDSWDEIDEDLKESFISQKGKINEMMERMRRF